MRAMQIYDALHDTGADPDAARRDRGRADRRHAAVLPGPRGADRARAGQPGADRGAEQHQPGVRRKRHLQGLPPGRPRAEPRPGGGHGPGRAGLHARRRALRLGRDQDGRCHDRARHLVPLPARRLGRLVAGRDQRARPVRDRGRPRGRGRRRLRRRGRAARRRDRAGPPGPGGRVRPVRARARGHPRAGRADVPAARHRRRDRARAGQVRRQGRRRLLQPGQADRAGPGSARARRLPPGPGDADPDRLGGAGLRGRARQPAGAAPGPVVPAAGRGRDAPLVRLRGQAPAADASGRGPAGPDGEPAGSGATARRSAPATPPPAAWTRRENSVLLRALLLDKAVYEVIYEARNRPHWLSIPLESMAEM